MNAKAIHVSLCALLLLGAGAQAVAQPRPVPQPAPAKMTVAETEAARQALINWFECEECEERQLQAVVKLGERVVPSLRAALLEGASPASEAFLRRELEKRYDQLRRYAETHPEAKVSSSREEFVAMYLANFHAQYRTRAAEALGRIGGATAVRALEEAAKGNQRPDVQESVKRALRNVKR
ncbi:MAG TPA: hypothetical protein VF698_01190 [Thermoanaerobaculia bacterium]